MYFKYICQAGTRDRRQICIALQDKRSLDNCQALHQADNRVIALLDALNQ